MFGEDAAKKIDTLPLSDNTVSRRIGDMAQDVSAQLLEQVRASEYFALQLDESTDLSCEAQLLVYIRFISNDRFVEEIRFLKHSKGERLVKTFFKFWTITLSLMDWTGPVVWGCLTELQQ